MPHCRHIAEALVAFRDRMPVDPDDLAICVMERLAVRGCGADWSVVMAGGAVRVFRKVADDKHVSRYVWAWDQTDAVIDHLMGRTD